MEASTSNGQLSSAPSPPRHAYYVLLAEFDIDEGSVLRHEYPCPTGVNQNLLAEHMLPDGAHDRAEDWTMFYLNQIAPFTVDSGLRTDGLMRYPLEERSAKGKEKASPEAEDVNGERELLYVMSLVRTKKVTTVRRGALVKAMAIVTPNPFIHIYKPLLLLALEDYFNDSTVSCLARLYDAVNALQMDDCPSLSLDERLILRSSDRIDMFSERFSSTDEPFANTPRPDNMSSRAPSRATAGAGRDDAAEVLEDDNRSISTGSVASGMMNGNNGSTEDVNGWKSSSRGRADTLNSSQESFRTASGGVNPLRPSLGRKQTMDSLRGGPEASSHSQGRKRQKDTHWYGTTVNYNGLELPMRLPLGTFPTEIGDYSLIKLVQTFSGPNALAGSGPLHPHLHTSGHQTPPIILLFNALVTRKRVVFLGFGQPAGEVANLVLAACALGSGCGTSLDGFVERAFPYTNLSNLDNLQNVEGFIAGVCNPAFAERPSWWDVLCNMESGKIVVSKDIAPAPQPAKALGSSTNGSSTSGGHHSSSSSVQEGESGGRPESSDSAFMEEILGAISAHYGETLIRARFTDYVERFIRVASRYEEDLTPNGGTTIGFPSRPFRPFEPGRAGALGSGAVFGDESTRIREMASHAGRIEGWRGTESYERLQKAVARRSRTAQKLSFDLVHQLVRLRYGKNLTVQEVELIFKTLVVNLRTEEQLSCLLANLPPHVGGLLPLSWGLFSPSENARSYTVDLLDQLDTLPTGRRFLQSLNAFQRAAYTRLQQERAHESPAIPILPGPDMI